MFAFAIDITHLGVDFSSFVRISVPFIRVRQWGIITRVSAADEGGGSPARARSLLSGDIPAKCKRNCLEDVLNSGGWVLGFKPSLLGEFRLRPCAYISPFSRN